MLKQYMQIAFLFFGSISSSYANELINFDDIIVGIESRESKIIKFECEFKVTLPQYDNHAISPKNIYRYFDGMEYCYEQNYFPFNEKVIEIFAWDKEKLFTHNIFGKDGTIRMPVGDEFYRQAHPLAMLGWRVGGKKYNETLAGHLKRSVNRTIKKVMYGGKTVYLLEGEIEIEVDNPATVLMVWIDLERDFVPLKIELHYVESPEKIALIKSMGIESASTLYRRIDKLKYEYEEVISTWFPVFGEDTYYTASLVFKDGYDENDIKGIPIGEQKKYVSGVERVPLGFGIWRYEVLKKNMDPDFEVGDFQIDYPDGTLIYNEFSDVAYKIGDSTWEPGGDKSDNHFDVDKIDLQETTTSVKTHQHNRIENNSQNFEEAEGPNNTTASNKTINWISKIGCVILGMVALFMVFRFFEGRNNEN